MRKNIYCEYCGKKIDGSYGSGRFCSKSCQAKWSNEHPITLEDLENGTYKNAKNGTAKVRAFLIRNGYKENKCEQCGLTKWKGLPITCELHHIDGDRQNNKLSNLQMLCPNCHSQTHNYGSKNKSSLKDKKIEGK